MAKSKRDSEAAYLARKAEHAQRERAAAERRRTTRTVVLVAGVVIALLGVLLIPQLLRDDQSPAQKRAAADAKLPVASFGVAGDQAGCAAQVLTPPQENWTKHIRGSWQYDAVPPPGGPHSQRTLGTGGDHFYERSEKPAPERAVHNLEHGLVVAWYDAALPDVEVDALRQVAAAAGDKKLRFVAVPWDRGTFAGDHHVVLTSWGVEQRCARVSGETIAAFVTKNADAPGLLERGARV